MSRLSTACITGGALLGLLVIGILNAAPYLEPTMAPSEANRVADWTGALPPCTVEDPVPASRDAADTASARTISVSVRWDSFRPAAGAEVATRVTEVDSGKIVIAGTLVADDMGETRLSFSSGSQVRLGVALGGVSGVWNTEKGFWTAAAEGLPDRVALRCRGKLRTVSGFVVDVTGNPVAGAQVRLGGSEALSGRSGEFTVSGHEIAESLLLRTSAEGFAEARTEVVGGRDLGGTFLWVCLERALVLTGTVVDRDLHPLRARIIVADTDHDGQTDEGGRFGVIVPNRPCGELHVSAPGFVMRRLEWRAGEDIHCVMDAGTPIRGVVVDTGGQPVDGAEVYVSVRPGRPPLAPNCRTDSAGCFIITDHVGVMASVCAVKGRDYSDTVVIRLPQVVPLRLCLAAERRKVPTSILVRDAETGVGVWCALIRRMQEPGPKGNAWMTDAYGSAHVLVEAGRKEELRVVVQSGEYLPMIASVIGGVSAEVTLTRAGCLEGVIVGAGGAQIQDLTVVLVENEGDVGRCYRRRFLGTGGAWDLRGLPLRVGASQLVRFEAPGYLSATMPLTVVRRGGGPSQVGVLSKRD